LPWLRFLLSSNPISKTSLAAAGLVKADAMLLSAEEAVRGNPAEADAQVLGGFLEVQHLLASNKQHQARAARAPQPAALSRSTSASLMPAPLAAVTSAGSKTFGRLASFGKTVIGAEDSPAVGTQSFSGAATHSLTGGAAADEPVPVAAAPASCPADGRQVLHIVACVSTTASKAVATAFFGPGNAAAVTGTAVGATAAGLVTSNSSPVGVVGSDLFTYELMVPGEIEGAVLVQVANEPLYIKVSTYVFLQSCVRHTTAQKTSLMVPWHTRGKTSTACMVHS